MPQSGLPVPTMKCSVIIVSYNEKHHLQELLPSLFKTAYDNFEVIFVDNSSTDGSVEYIRSSYPSVKIVQLSKNEGFAGPNNIGYEHSSGELIVLLNADTLVDKDWLGELVKTSQEDEKIGIVGSLPLTMSEKWTKPLIITETTYVSQACAAALLIKRKLIQEIGLFDPEFFISFEDTDLSYRALLKGWDVCYSPRSYIYHHESTTQKRFEPQSRYYRGVRNQVLVGLRIFERKNLLPFIRRPFGIFFRGLLMRNMMQIKSGIQLLFYLVRNLGIISRKRAFIQSSRTCDDSRIFELIEGEKPFRQQLYAKRA